MVNITERDDGTCVVEPNPLYEIRLHAQVFNYIVAVLWFLFSIPIMVLYFVRRNHPYIKKRHFPFMPQVVAMYAAICCQLVIGPIRTAVGIPNFSCIYFLLNSQAIVPLFGLTLILRIFLFTREASRAVTLEKISFAGFASYFATGRQQSSNDNEDEDMALSASPFGSSALESGAEEGNIDGEGHAGTTFKSGTNLSSFDSGFDNTARASNLGVGDGYGDNDGDGGSVHTTRSKGEIARKIGQATSTTWLVFLAPLVVVTVFVSMTGYFLSLEQYKRNCLGCVLHFLGAAVFLVEIIFISLAMVYGFQRAKSYPDPLDVKRDILLSIKIGVPIGIFGLVMGELDPGNLDARAEFKWGFFNFLGLAIAWCIQVIPPLRTSYRQSGRIAEDQNLLREIMKDPLGVEAFRKHLVTEHSAELIRFVIHVRKWKTLFARTGGNEPGHGSKDKDHDNDNDKDKDKDNKRVVDEKKRIMYGQEIYRLFIADDAPLFVNIGYELRQPILKAFSFVEEGKVVPESPDQVPDNIFDAAVEDVKEMLERDALPRFKKTKGYKEWAGIEEGNGNKPISQKRGSKQGSKDSKGGEDEV